MNKRIKKEWVEALRSGKYEQGTKCLQKDNKYCCLGVLCDIYDKSKWNGQDSLGIWEHSGYRFCLPEPVKLELGLFSDEEDYLMAMNDEEGRSFEEIADWIEVNL